MKNRNASLQDLKIKMAELQKQIDAKEQELNIQIGKWVRKQTSLDSLDDIRQNYRLVNIHNEKESITQNNHNNVSIYTQTTALKSADMTTKPSSDFV